MNETHYFQIEENNRKGIVEELVSFQMQNTLMFKLQTCNL